MNVMPISTPSLDNLSELARRILQELGITDSTNCGILIDCSWSMADELGLDKQRQPIANGGISQVERAVTTYLALAQHLDPNGVAQGGVFSDIARMGEPIHLDNHRGWIERNRLNADEMEGTNLTAALQMMLRAIAVEVDCPEIAELALFANTAHHGKVPAKPIVTTPYQLVIMSDGEQEDVTAIENLLRAMSWAPIEVIIIYVSNQPAGLDILHALTKIRGRLTDNVRLVDLGRGGLLNVTDEQLLRTFAGGLAQFHARNAEHGLV
jgi:hypothetical protein